MVAEGLRDCPAHLRAVRHEAWVGHVVGEHDQGCPGVLERHLKVVHVDRVALHDLCASSPERQEPARRSPEHAEALLLIKMKVGHLTPRRFQMLPSLRSSPPPSFAPGVSSRPYPRIAQAELGAASLGNPAPPDHQHPIPLRTTDIALGRCTGGPDAIASPGPLQPRQERPARQTVPCPCSTWTPIAEASRLLRHLWVATLLNER